MTRAGVENMRKNVNKKPRENTRMTDIFFAIISFSPFHPDNGSFVRRI
jgi:hypothetical protein